ncbi:Crp/Fnr family transcriptional regulator [Campylobacter sp. RM13119]|uniref:Crp/Fnr family transcriptional regulator n=1 Tax=Campylobacter californiensis TaxID=1032243 RepID=UPI001473FC21|nr:Crp/Fnr family transcriptional regulator [Campylobacter sp. RM13119]MBE3606928.1 Crp/Fnr family transcriptional regulator [Campylobacter sp. RM13119]
MLNEADRKFLDKSFLSKFEISDAHKQLVMEKSLIKTFKKDEIIYTKDGCKGFIVVKSGNIRAYIASSNFKEITVFSLKDNESCVLCSSCVKKNFEIEINLQVYEDTEVVLIPIDSYKILRDIYPEIMSFTLNLISTRFASVITVMEQALFLPLVERIKNFLEQNSTDSSIKITHEQLANHIGSAREAVSRVLKEMEKEGQIEQKRGVITLRHAV